MAGAVEGSAGAGSVAAVCGVDSLLDSAIFSAACATAADSSSSNAFPDRPGKPATVCAIALASMFLSYGVFSNWSLSLAIASPNSVANWVSLLNSQRV